MSSGTQAAYFMSSNQNSYGLNYIDPSTVAAEDPALNNDWLSWVRAGRRVPDERSLQWNSFSGVDIKAAIWIPPSRYRSSGTYKEWAELQTVTVSSERPAGPVRVLGMATPRDFIRGVRTIAGSLIFTILDYDVFSELLQPSDKESPADNPIYVDSIPPFHIILTAKNEMGASSSLSIIDCTLTNMGQTYSVDDLLLESTYTYVAKYVTPFMNKRGWQAGLSSAVSKMNGSVERVSNLHPRRQSGQAIGNDEYSPDLSIDPRYLK